MELGNAANLSIRKLLEDAVASNTDPKVAEKLQACIAKNDSLNRYLENTCSEPSALQKIILDDTMAESWKELYNKGITSCILGPMGMSGHYEGIFLKLIAELTKAERILEIGMYTGCSAVSFCESTFSKEVVSLEYEPYLEEFVTKRTKNTIAEKKHRILIGKALDSLEKLKLEGKTFDLVFIDADKNNYLNYYNFIMDNGLLAPGGNILVDNALLFGTVYPVPSTESGAIVAKLNETIKADNRVEQVLLPIRDGVFLVHFKQNL